MNREIKFRAWNERHRFMDSAWLLDFEHGEVCHQKHNASEIDDCILIQFTGFMDSDGKEVYDGDIIKHPKGDIGYVFMSETGQWKVRYEDYIDYALFLQIGDKGQGIVVGNICQNPELLKRKI